MAKKIKDSSGIAKGRDKRSVSDPIPEDLQDAPIITTVDSSGEEQTYIIGGIEPAVEEIILEDYVLPSVIDAPVIDAPYLIGSQLPSYAIDIPAHMMWWKGNKLLRGYDPINQEWVNDAITFGVVYPGIITNSVTVIITSSFRLNNKDGLFDNMRVVLQGTDEELELFYDSGVLLDISFDRGKSYNTFSTTYGYKGDPDTWQVIPASSITRPSNNPAIDGRLGWQDSANMLVRYRIPDTSDDFRMYNVSIDIAAEII